MVDIVTRLGKGSPLTNAEVDANFTNLAEVSGVTGEPMGHEDRTTSTISFNASTRTFTIAPVASSFTVWCKGKKVVVSTAQTVTIPNTTGMYSIYYDANGVLSAKSGYFTFSLEAPTAYVYWNAATGTAPYFGDERHGVVLDWQTHEYLHRTRGAALASGFSASGYVLGGNGSSNSHAQITLEGGTFFDEDMKIIVTATNTPTAGTWEQDLLSPARIPVLYLSGTGWVIDAPTDYPLKQGTARPQYNAYSGGVWSTADVANNKYATSWILATNNLTYPVIAIIGQAENDLQSAAEAVDFTALQLPGFPSVEFRPLYKLIFQCADSCTNAVHASLVSITDIRSIAAAGTAASIVTDHGNLSGLSDDDHPQYIHVDTLRTVSAAVKASFLPSQTSNAGKFLQTDGTATSWQALTSSNVTTALGFTPYNATNPSGYISGITSGMVTTALGFTPYNATNPSGYVTAAGARGAISVTGAGSYDSATGVINIVGGVTSFNTRTGAITLSSADVTTALGFTPYNNTNPSGYITGITSTMVTTALGYTPYNSSNPNGYISSITSANVTTALGFTPYNATNPSGYITSSALSGYLTSASAASTYLPLSGGTLTGTLGLAATSGTNGFYNGTGDGASFTTYNFLLRGWNGMAFQNPTSGGTYPNSITGYLDFREGIINMKGGFRVNGSVVLCGDNYNSYAPTLTGTGASGTWSISITGTAGAANSATSAGYLTGGDSAFYGLLYNSLAGDLNTYNSPGLYSAEYIGSTNKPSGATNGHIIQISDAGGTDVKTQWYFPSSGVTPYMRLMWGNTYWQSWQALLTSGNFTSYAMPSGSSATNSVDVRAPIFYDSQDTGFYVDPTGASRILQLYVDGVHQGGYGIIKVISDNDALISLYTENNTNAGMRLQSNTGGTDLLFVGKKTGSNTQFVVDFGFAQSAEEFTVDASGNTESRTSSRAPIFYDSGNTSYYIDPTGGSKLNSLLEVKLNADGDFFIGRFSAGAAKLVYAYQSGSDGYLEVRTGADDIVSKLSGYSGTPSYMLSNVGIGIASPSYKLHVSGTGYATSDLRAPAFYASNNTAYYGDFAGTSKLLGLCVSDAAGTGWGINLYSGSGYQPTYGLFFATTANFGTYGGVSADWATYFTMNGTSGRGWIYRSATSNVASINTDGLATFGGGINLNTAGNALIRYLPPGTGTVSINAPFYWNGVTGAINIAMTDNDTGGIVIDNEGVTVYGAGDTGGVFRVIDEDVWQSNGQNVVAATGLYVNQGVNGGWGRGNWEFYSSARAPIFYDLDNTAYYGDFASTSVINNLNVAGAIQSTNGYGRILLYGHLHIDSFSGNDIYLNYYSSRAVRAFYGSYVESFRADTDGIIYAYSQFRTPILYDNNDTSFYLNPNSTSVLNGIDIKAGSSIQFYTAAGSLRGYINVTDTDDNHLQIATSGGEDIVFKDAGLSGTRNFVIRGSNAGSEAYGSMRSPIFYDSNDTGYYTNPNGTSNLSEVYVAAATVRIGRTHSEGGEVRFLNTAQNNGGYIQGWDSGIRTVDHNWTTTTWSIDNAGNSSAVASHRAPIFYDSGNTGYYLDPASTNSLRTVGDWRADSAAWTGEFSGKIQYHSTNWYFQYSGSALFRNSGGSNIFTIDQSGNVVASGNVTAYSDVRLKENIVTIDSALDKVLHLRGVYYNKIGNPDRRVGVIAQEIEIVLPEVVRSISDTNPSTGETQYLLAVDYGNISGLLIEAIKEQDQQVTDLRTRVAQLESLITKLIGD